MLKAGIIRVNNNPTTAMAVLVVPKKGPKKFRLVVDFRPLNKITQEVRNSLPKIEVQLLRAREMKFFSSFDLLSGFDYLPCTMETGRVAYSFKGAPQGWNNTLSLFSMRQIYDVLVKAGIWPRNCMQWIDDTVIMAGSLEELFKILERYLKRIEELNLRLNVDKCHLVGLFATFCGRKVDGSGYQYDRSYVDELLSRANPRYVHELAQFIYTANFLCSILPGFSKLRHRITKNCSIAEKIKTLERKKLLIKWTDEMREAFEQLKEVLRKSLHRTLGHYNHLEPTYIFCDASDFYWSLILAQTKEEVNTENPYASNFRIISMTSGTFKGLSFDWHISSKELFPVVVALKKFPYYLLYNFRETILFTDHRNLVGILSPKQVSIKAYAARLGCWAADFMTMNLKVYHLPGYRNIPPDIISPWMNPGATGKEQIPVKIVTRAEEEYWKLVDSFHVSGRHPSKNRSPAASWGVMDELFVLKIQQLENVNLKEVWRERGKIVLSRHLIPYAIVHAHAVFNHGAEKREAEFIRKHYTIEKGLKALFLQTLKKFRRQCLHCQRRSLIINRPLNVTEFGREARQVLYSDFLYINRSGWILTVVDSLTRTTLLHFCPKVEAKEVVKALWKWHAHFHLAPEFLLVTDQGSHFVNQMVNDFFKSCNGTHRVTAAYISQTTGTVEVQNREVLRHLRSLVSELGLPSNRWGEVILMVQTFLNSTPLTCRGGNKSPVELLMGVKPRVSLMGVKPRVSLMGGEMLQLTERDVLSLKRISEELHERIRSYQEDAYRKGLLYRYQANKRMNKRLKPINFHPGEYVLLSEKGFESGHKDKCRPRWTGPVQVVEII
eukprot:maker-scaffold_24-snap-gene-0.13-mRNA-1 protein AED:0.39 eAED:0.40 QI:0/0/0/0.5/1/1/2/0/835